MDSEKIVLAGYSHGGWSILDALHYGDELPPNLLDSPGKHLDGVKAVLAYYPYCSFSAANREGWKVEIPVLLYNAGQDTVVSPTDCQTMIENTQTYKFPVKEVYLAEARHGFDSPSRNFNPKLYEIAQREQYAFLNKYLSAAPRNRQFSSSTLVQKKH